MVKKLLNIALLTGLSLISFLAQADGSSTPVFIPAPHFPLPQIPGDFQKVIHNPKFQAITYAGDPWAAQIEDFVAKFAVSPEWKTMLAEYGVQAASAATPIRLSEPIPSREKDNKGNTIISRFDITQWFRSQLTGSIKSIADFDTETIYAIILPESVTAMLGDGDFGCKAFLGYHWAFGEGDKIYPFVVIPRCKGMTFDDFTFALSHELAEAATDPGPVPGFEGFAAEVDAVTMYKFGAWFDFAGPELADLCELNYQSQLTPKDLGYQIQQIWSNSSALSSAKDPCNPINPNSLYFNAAPRLMESVPNLAGSGEELGVHIAEGKTKTIELDLFSSGPTSEDWTISAIEILEDGETPHLSFTYDKRTGSNGSILHLNITVEKAAPSKSELFVIISTLRGVRNYWPVGVGN